MLIAHFYPNFFMNRFTSYVDDYEFMLNQCTEKVDLIYCGSVSQLDKAIMAKERYQKPLVCWVWDLPYCWREWTRNETEKKENFWRDERVERYVSALQKCDRIISSSKYTQKVLKEKYGMESEQIYFYIDTEEFDALKSPVGDYVIQISRFALNKRFDISIRAMSGINRRLVLVGTGKSDYLEALAESLDVDVSIYKDINRGKLLWLLKSAEILVSPSVFEGWGITPIEALYCGKAVLLSDLEVFREVYGDSVLYHKRDDVEDMREKLEKLLGDKQLQKKIINDCAPLISDFTIPKFAKRWKKIIEGIRI